MVLRQSKRPLTFLLRPLGDMFCKSEGLIQSGTHILSHCADSFAIELSPPTGLYRLPMLIGQVDRHAQVGASEQKPKRLYWLTVGDQHHEARAAHSKPNSPMIRIP